MGIDQRASTTHTTTRFGARDSVVTEDCNGPKAVCLAWFWCRVGEVVAQSVLFGQREGNLQERQLLSQLRCKDKVQLSSLNDPFVCYIKIQPWLDHNQNGDIGQK